ncbi:unnamed protein product [Eruca vesicaria subsp. sativa]|uniref:Uncharacterized protein n=1 Tax=Eruca vesicaria subsp. sativa TaxID=29727 RepID=A0ABC8KCJ6_ERUVS|nr:unnamed protein product [Eruca vesicaria subsp. sativa]
MVHHTRLQNDVGAAQSSESPPCELARLNSKEECQKDDKTENEHGLINSARSQDSGIRTENEHGLAVASSVMSQVSDIQPSVAIRLPAGFDDCRKETEEALMQTSASSVQEQKEILQQLSGKSVEESCIIVDRDELHCVFPDRKENDKHKPYQNIRDGISSRMKQNREKAYKHLALQWYAEDVVNGRECGDNPKQIEENLSSEESEWELL